jgi:hypothetical protein
MRRRWVGTGFFAVAGLFATATLAAPCEKVVPVYLPYETAIEPYGLRGETRAEFLKRTVGETRAFAQDDDTLQILGALDDTELRLEFTRATDVVMEQIALVNETRIDVLEKDNRRARAFGHRPLGSYAVKPDERVTLRVPFSSIRENGHLLVIVTLKKAGSAREYRVRDYAVTGRPCEARLYVKDRFTLIRLTREQEKQK